MPFTHKFCYRAGFLSERGSVTRSKEADSGVLELFEDLEDGDTLRVTDPRSGIFIRSIVLVKKSSKSRISAMSLPDRFGQHGRRVKVLGDAPFPLDIAEDALDLFGIESHGGGYFRGGKAIVFAIHDHVHFVVGQ